MAKARVTNGQAAARLLDPKVIEELARETPGFDRGALLTAIIEAWGGYDQFANDVAKEFAHAQRGSMVRQRTLEMVVRLIDRETEKSAQLPPAEQMTEEELMRTLASAAEKMMVGGGTDGPTAA